MFNWISNRGVPTYYCSPRQCDRSDFFLPHRIFCASLSRLRKIYYLKKTDSPFFEYCWAVTTCMDCQRPEKEKDPIFVFESTFLVNP